MKLLPTTKATLLTMFSICFVLIGSAATAQIDTTRYITKTIIYTDTAAVRRTIEEAKRTLALRNQKMQALREELVRMEADYEYIKNNEGKEVQNESQQQLINEVVATYPDKKAEKQAAKGIIPAKAYNTYMKLNQHRPIRKYRDFINFKEPALISIQQNIEQFEKDFDRTKKVIYGARLRGLDENFEEIDYNKLYNDWQDTTEVIIGSKDRLANYIVVDGQKIPNQGSWLWLYHHNNSEWKDRLTAFQNQDWEWANIDSLERINLSYPMEISYYASDKHPEYAIIDNAVYTKAGTLVRIIDCKQILLSWDNDNLSEVILNHLYKKDYEANKYNIKEKGAKTQKYIMRELGYASAQKSKAEQEQDAKRNQEMWKTIYKLGQESEKAKMDQRYAKNSTEYYQAKQAENRASLQVLKTLAANGDKDYDEAGVAYLDQLKTDHEESVGKIYYCERNDDTSFIFKYTGKEHGYTIKITYNQSEPFSCNYTATIISEDEPVNINDFK